MRLETVLSALAPVVGLTSVMSAPTSVRLSQPNPNRITLGGAAEALADAEERQRTCTSDAAYWGYEGQRAYWQTVVYLFQAAETTGPDDLPDIAIPDLTNKVVMDAAFYMERFGRDVYDAARCAGGSGHNNGDQP